MKRTVKIMLTLSLSLVALFAQTLAVSAKGVGAVALATPLSTPIIIAIAVISVVAAVAFLFMTKD